eukprot:scaffold4658_cov118-Cylindrotheca_fusiformis.AAC.21
MTETDHAVYEERERQVGSVDQDPSCRSYWNRSDMGVCNQLSRNCPLSLGTANTVWCYSFSHWQRTRRNAVLSKTDRGNSWRALKETRTGLPIGSMRSLLDLFEPVH